jgi:hypothetical protein
MTNSFAVFALSLLVVSAGCGVAAQSNQTVPCGSGPPRVISVARDTPSGVFARPADVQNGDVLVVTFLLRASTSQFEPFRDGFWTFHRRETTGNRPTIEVWTRAITEACNEPASYGFFLNAQGFGFLSVVRGADVSRGSLSVFDNHTGLAVAECASVSCVVTAPSVSTTVADTLLFSFLAGYSTSTTGASMSWSQISPLLTGVVEGNAGGANGVSGILGFETVNSTGPTGGRTARLATAAGRVIATEVAVSLAIAPCTAGNDPSSACVTQPPYVHRCYGERPAIVGSRGTLVTNSSGLGAIGVTADMPAAVAIQTNDLVFASVQLSAPNTTAVQAPTGWTFIRSDSSAEFVMALLYFVFPDACAAIPTAFDFPVAGPFSGASVVLTVARGIDPQSPVQQDAGRVFLAGIAGGTTSIATPPLTTQSAKVLFFSTYGVVSPPPAAPWNDVFQTTLQTADLDSVHFIATYDFENVAGAVPFANRADYRCGVPTPNCNTTWAASQIVMFNRCQAPTQWPEYPCGTTGTTGSTGTTGTATTGSATTTTGTGTTGVVVITPPAVESGASMGTALLLPLLCGGAIAGLC